MQTGSSIVTKARSDVPSKANVRAVAIDELGGAT
jgi:hypothetical protein